VARSLSAARFDVEYHHVVFHNIKDVLFVSGVEGVQVRRAEELHNNIIDKGLLKLCQREFEARRSDGRSSIPMSRSRRRSSSASHSR